MATANVQGRQEIRVSVKVPQAAHKQAIKPAPNEPWKSRSAGPLWPPFVVDAHDSLLGKAHFG